MCIPCILGSALSLLHSARGLEARSVVTHWAGFAVDGRSIPRRGPVGADQSRRTNTRLSLPGLMHEEPSHPCRMEITAPQGDP